jgi:hypothetical protein
MKILTKVVLIVTSIAIPVIALVKHIGRKTKNPNAKYCESLKDTSAVWVDAMKDND